MKKQKGTMGEELRYVQMTRWSMHIREGSKQQ